MEKKEVIEKPKKGNENELIFGMEMWKIKSLIPVVGCALIIIASIGLIVLPKLSQIQSFSKQKLDLTGKSDDIKNKISYLKSMDESALKNKEDVLLMAMPESKDIYFLLNVITDLSKQYEFFVSGFSFSPGNIEGESENKKEDLEQVDFGMTLTGPVSKYIDLVEGFESSLPILTINEVDSKSIPGDLVEINISISTHFAVGKNKVDVSKLTYRELVMTDKETKLLEELAGYRKIEGLNVGDSNAGGKLFQEYEVRNPFVSVN